MTKKLWFVIGNRMMIRVENIILVEMVESPLDGAPPYVRITHRVGGDANLHEARVNTTFEEAFRVIAEATGDVEPDPDTEPEEAPVYQIELLPDVQR